MFEQLEKCSDFDLNSVWVAHAQVFRPVEPIISNI